jgi:hypothetical protein
MIKLRRMRWAVQVARMGGRRRGSKMCPGYWLESQRGRGHIKDQDADGWIILRYVWERWDGIVWIGLVWLRIWVSRRFFGFHKMLRIS